MIVLQETLKRSRFAIRCECGFNMHTKNQDATKETTEMNNFLPNKQQQQKKDFVSISQICCHYEAKI